jgi:hypothetical protein
MERVGELLSVQAIIAEEKCGDAENSTSTIFYVVKMYGY